MYIPDPDHVLVIEPIEVTEDLTYEECSVHLLDYRTKQQRNKQIPLVKVLWANHTSSQATWETEKEMRAKYLHLFDVTLPLTRLISFEGKTL